MVAARNLRLIRNVLLPLLLLCAAGRAQPAQDEDRVARRNFEAALAGDVDAARRSLPLMIDRPWLGEINFLDACSLARAVEEARQPSDLAYRLVLAAGLHNPGLALRESGEYLPLESGHRLFERFVLAAPGEAMELAAGSTRSAREIRELLTGAVAPELALLARLAGDASIDLPRRNRVAILAGRIARGSLSLESALRIAQSTPQFFATVLDLRATASVEDAAALDQALENESLALCRAVQENPGRALAGDLARFRARDLYAVLALGRAEATPPVFAAIFDRLLLPKWKAETPRGASLTAFLDQTRNWELRDFAAGALNAHCFDGLLAVAGADVESRLVRGIDQAPDPLKEATRLAEIIDATASPALVERMATIVAAEFARCREAGDRRGTTLYGLLAARLSLDAAGPYLPFFRSSETLDTAILFGAESDCIERYFFWDDEDGIQSFESFRNSYEHDPAWEIEERPEYVHLVGHGPEGRRIEIFANVPIDGHLPKNRALEGEAQRRQQSITAVLGERALVPTVLVHRGHSFWVGRTLSYLSTAARLVILGSCGGTTQIHAVIEASHDAQVIATRGVGETQINDAILKAVNDRILTGDRVIQWDSFWQELKARWGRSALFHDYVAPHQDSGTVLLRAYYRFLDALN